MRLPHQVECWVFKKTVSGYLFLLLKRVSKKGGFWQPITGGIESTDKNNLDSCYRELVEEANISKSDVIRAIEDFYYFEFEFEDKDDKNKISKEYCFGFEVAPDFEIDLSNNLHSEHEEFKWLKFDDALKMLKWKDNKDALRVLNNKL